MNNKQQIIQIGDRLLQSVASVINQAFIEIGNLYGEDGSAPAQLRLFTNGAVDLDNLTADFQTLSTQKETEEIMNAIKAMKNARVRTDGRYEWRKTINGHNYSIIDSKYNRFVQRVRELKRQLRSSITCLNALPQKQSLHQVIQKYYERNILAKVARGTLKQRSAERYIHAIKLLEHFDKPIGRYTKDDIIDFLNQITQPRNGSYCYHLLKRVFADEVEKGNLRVNPIATLENPFPAKRCSVKGSWIDLDGQKKLKANLDNSILSKEILFFLVTGCRLREAYDAEIDFEKRRVLVHRHKTEFSGVKSTNIPLSARFCDLIKDDWSRMFKLTPNVLSRKITEFFQSIGIQDKSTHDLRHTFASNLYYLKTDAKVHQYLMGHASIQQTYDTYTTLDMTITKQDIIDLWGDLYPEY